MRLHRPLAIAIVALTILSGFGISATGSSALAQRDPEPIGVTAAKPGRLIVLLKDSVSEAGTFSAAADYAEQPGVTITNQYNALVSGFAGTFDQAAINSLKTDPNVTAVLPDRVFYPAAQVDPTGPFRVGADKNATKVGNGSGSVDVDVAVFDTGVYKHSDLNVVGGKDCTGGNNPYNDVYGHGTAVAGCQ